MQTFKLSDFDPCAVDLSADVIAKYHHHLEEKQRVRVIADGRTGVLQTISPGERHWVKLDSGHTIHCREFELEPEDFPHSEPAPAKTTLTAAQFDGLQRKLALGELDELDTHRVKKAFQLLAVSGLDGPETASDQILREMVRKHLGTSSSEANSFAKAAGAGRATFQVGDRFKDRWGECGKITAVDEGRADVQYDSGIYGTVLLGHLKAT